MARITVEDCLEKVDNRFSLVILVAKRAKQLIKGDEPTVKSPGNKQVVNALREVAEGNVNFSADETSLTRYQQIEDDLNRSS